MSEKQEHKLDDAIDTAIEAAQEMLDKLAEPENVSKAAKMIGIRDGETFVFEGERYVLEDGVIFDEAQHKEIPQTITINILHSVADVMPVVEWTAEEKDVAKWAQTFGLTYIQRAANSEICAVYCPNGFVGWVPTSLFPSLSEGTQANFSAMLLDAE